MDHGIMRQINNYGGIFKSFLAGWDNQYLLKVLFGE
jgi:hypothetical protein